MLRELVDVGRIDLTTVAPQVRVPEIIGQYH